MKKIFLVQYHYFDGDCSGIVDLKAFLDEEKARQLVSDCTSEALRIEKEVKQYWEEHRAEDERLMFEIRKQILSKKYDVKSPENRRRREIMNGEREIIKTHKYHPGYIHDWDEQSSYEISEIELVE